MAEQELLGRVAHRLAAVKVDWMVTGSVAAIWHGVSRNTHDIDIVIDLSAAQVQAIVDAFPEPEFYIDAAAVRHAVTTGLMFNVIHNPTGVKVDFWPLRDRPFDELTFTERELREVEGRSIAFIRPEHLILQKLRWSKDSGGSEKQFADCLAVYEMRASEIDQALLDHWALTIGVKDDLDRLRAQAEPL